VCVKKFIFDLLQKIEGEKRTDAFAKEKRREKRVYHICHPSASSRR
jgi:hypothetical protein